MKSSSKINLPPIPPSIFNKRIPSANNPNEVETENEKDKDKEKPTKTLSPNPDIGTIPIPKYKPPYKNVQKKNIPKCNIRRNQDLRRKFKKGCL